MNFIFPADVCFECNLCGLCCGDTEQKTRHILLLESEAQQIASQTGKKITDFAVQTLDKKPYIYEMKKPVEGKCIFLKHNRCQIYELRPLICRFYPFQLTFNKDSGQHVFDFTFECPGINRGKICTKKDFESLFLLAMQRLP